MEKELTRWVTTQQVMPQGLKQKRPGFLMTAVNFPQVITSAASFSFKVRQDPHHTKGHMKDRQHESAVGQQRFPVSFEGGSASKTTFEFEAASP